MYAGKGRIQSGCYAFGPGGNREEYESLIFSLKRKTPDEIKDGKDDGKNERTKKDQNCMYDRARL